MDDNPYTAPRTTSDVPRQVRVRTRFGFGNALFLGLGGVLVLLSGTGAVYAINEATLDVGVVIGITAIMLLGALLIAHGVIRSSATILAITIMLIPIIFLVFAAVILL